MVKPTTHLGTTGQVDAVPAAAALDQPRYPGVYESTRVVTNVQLMQIAQATSADTVNQYKLSKAILHPDRVSNIHKDHDTTCKGKIESTYQVYLAWKEWHGMNASIGLLAHRLREHGFLDVAESFPP